VGSGKKFARPGGAVEKGKRGGRDRSARGIYRQGLYGINTRGVSGGGSNAGGFQRERE
jgi:hypothetical protein